MSDLSTRMRSRAAIEIDRLRVEQAERQTAFENARTRLHNVNAEYAEARSVETRWREALQRAKCPRIGKVEA